MVSPVQVEGPAWSPSWWGTGDARPAGAETSLLSSHCLVLAQLSLSTCYHKGRRCFPGSSQHCQIGKWEMLDLWGQSASSGCPGLAGLPLSLCLCCLQGRLAPSQAVFCLWARVPEIMGCGAVPSAWRALVSCLPLFTFWSPFMVVCCVTYKVFNCA